MSGLLTDASASSFLLPTPSASEPGFRHRTPLTKDGEPPTHGAQRWYDAETGRVMQKGLTQVMALLPTPQAADAEGGRIDTRETVLSGRRPSGAKASVSLREALTYKLLPTPVSSDGDRGPDYAAETREGTGGDSLTTTVAKLLPTPRATREGSATETVQLLPTPTAMDSAGTKYAVHRSTGASMSPPSDDGNDSSDPHPHQLTIEDA